MNSYQAVGVTPPPEAIIKNAPSVAQVAKLYQAIEARMKALEGEKKSETLQERAHRMGAYDAYYWALWYVRTILEVDL